LIFVEEAAEIQISKGSVSVVIEPSMGEGSMQLLTETEVSRILKCTKAALRRWRREGRGPRFIKLGRMVRYSESDVLGFLVKNAKGGPLERSMTPEEPTRAITD
jgi:predicted DNA-binding transcriptional regulator AlpA